MPDSVPVCQPVCLSVYLSDNLSACLSVCVTVCLSAVLFLTEKDVRSLCASVKAGNYSQGHCHIHNHIFHSIADINSIVHCHTHGQTNRVRPETGEFTWLCHCLHCAVCMDEVD